MFLFWPEALEKFLDDHHCFRLATALNIFKTVCHMPIAKTDVQGERADRYKAEDKEALETLHRREQLLEKRMAIEMKTEKHTSAELEELNILDSELKVLKAKYWKHQDEMYQLQPKRATNRLLCGQKTLERARPEGDAAFDNADAASARAQV
ncbi:uncharacterized protein CIMG_12285 [Coccidioides immitis RS]|uniref:Uncharacterized protein n=1 Tax=Coccidioides immitis (strain RS) TaxID=246410 RepID=A0A0D8JW25_COCIM|nr:uncharacterized protein CIMG_12285 [Coccidioides immitis RS]KJF61324.1 hypothetical protein CIMG_12285 [Coccidioides immitis RS]TPX20580.1 hypothetical protein DIZ76_016472 [Coccidioides immitis]